MQGFDLHVLTVAVNGHHRRNATMIIPSGMAVVPLLRDGRRAVEESLSRFALDVKGAIPTLVGVPFKLWECRAHCLYEPMTSEGNRRLM